LRASVDDFATLFRKTSNTHSQMIDRAEQVSAAQRLEWAWAGNSFGACLPVQALENELVYPAGISKMPAICIKEPKMLFFVRAVVDVVTKANLQRESERRLHFATDRFRENIREIGVALRDVNGPRGGIDKQCKITAKLWRGGSVEIEETRSSFIEAVGRAAKRLRNVLARRIGGKQPNKTLRHIYPHEPYRLPQGFL
jgi:putative sigma-54 modulation protein